MSIQMKAVFALLLLIVATTALMHEDEVGLRDWYHQGLGKVGLASFAMTPSSKQIVVASTAQQQPLIASVAHADGSIRWRQLLDSHAVCLSTTETTVMYVTARGTGAVLAVSNGNVVQTFSIAFPQQDAVVRDCTHRAPAGRNQQPNLTIAVSVGKTVYLYEGSSWDEETPIIHSRTFELSSGDNITAAKLAGHHNLWLERNLTAFDVIELESGDVSPTGVQGKLEGTTPSGDALLSFVKSDEKETCEATRGKMARVMSAKNKVVKALDGNGRSTSCKDCFVGVAVTTSHATGDVVAVVKAEDGQSLDLYHMTHGKFTLPYVTQYPPRVLAVRSTDKKAEVLVRFTSHHVALLSIHHESGASLVWERFEGLSSPAVARVVPLPRLKAPSSVTSSRDQLFGFEVYAIVVSTAGVVYRMPVQQQQRNATPPVTVVRDLSGAAYAALGGCPCSIKYVDLVVSDNGVAAIAARNKKGTVTLLVDVVTGALVDTKKYSSTEALFTSATTIVDKESLVVERLSGAVKDDAQYLFRAAVGDNEIRGLMVPAGKTTAIPTWTIRTRGAIVATASPNADPLSVLTVENLRMFPNVTFKKDKITEVRRRYPTDNILVVAHFEPEVTTTEEPSEVEDVESVDTADTVVAGWQRLVVSVIDTVTGSVLARVSHAHVSGRVHILVVEHVVMYHFLNVEKMRYALGVMELLLPESDVVLESTGTSPARIVASLFAKQQTFSSYSAQPPIAANQVLSFPAGAVEAVGVTTSFQGVSRKQVLFALASGGVIAVDLRAMCFGGQTNPQKPEEVFTHVAAATENILSHRHIVAGAKLVTTTPTELESSSHMLVAGLDMFYARVSSGKAFDLLNDDFNHEMLLVMCGVLLVVSLALRLIVERKSLLEAWA